MPDTSRIEIWLTKEELEQVRILAAKNEFRSSGKYLQSLTRQLLKDESGVPVKEKDIINVNSGVMSGPAVETIPDQKDEWNRPGVHVDSSKIFDPTKTCPECGKEVVWDGEAAFCPSCAT